MAEDRLIAGIRCLQVLEKLDSYVADELTAPERTQIDAHLRECDWCTRFGGRYAQIIELLRNELAGQPPPLVLLLVALFGLSQASPMPSPSLSS